MKIRYFLKPWVLLIAIIIILSLIFHSFIYNNIIKKNKDYLPGFIAQWIEERDSRKTPSPIVYKQEKTIKILEGWTLVDISNYLEELGWSSEEFSEIAGESAHNYINEERDNWPKDYSSKFSFLESKPEYFSLEGFLFPDTYRVFADASVEEIILTMLNNFDKKLTPELREEIEAQGKDVYEIITMASLIEKEAPIDYSDPENTDARLVSGIFWNRLEYGQALESDATLSYLFNDNNPAHSLEDLKVDSPYNSYMYRGLPPTPISNPGMKSIKAAIYPMDTDYNYFLTTYDGEEIYYAKTYQEHLSNKYKYLK